MPKGIYARRKKDGRRDRTEVRKGGFASEWRKTYTKNKSGGYDRQSETKAVDPGVRKIVLDSRPGKSLYPSKAKSPASKKGSKPTNRAKPTGKNYRRGGKTLSLKKGSSRANPGKSRSRMKKGRK